MATVAQCFCGQVEQREYAQFLDKERIPTLLVDGKPASWKTVTYLSRTTERTFRFEGLTDAQAHATDSVTVTDVSGTQYTVPMECAAVDGSTGTAVFVSHSVEVARRRTSPHLWAVTVVVRDATLETKTT